MLLSRERFVAVGSFWVDALRRSFNVAKLTTIVLKLNPKSLIELVESPQLVFKRFFDN